MAMKAYFISVECMEDDELSSSAKLLYAILSTCCGKSADGFRLSAWPSLSQLHKRSGVRDIRSLKRAIAELCRAGAIREVTGGYHVLPYPAPLPDAPENNDAEPAVGTVEVRVPHKWEGVSDLKAYWGEIKRTGISLAGAQDAVITLHGLLSDDDIAGIGHLVQNAMHLSRDPDRGRVWSPKELIDAAQSTGEPICKQMLVSIRRAVKGGDQ